MANEAQVSVIGFVATQPIGGYTKTGARSVSMRVGWTPRVFDRDTGAWTDQASSFLTVQCYRKVAEHAAVTPTRGPCAEPVFGGSIPMSTSGSVSMSAKDLADQVRLWPTE